MTKSRKPKRSMGPADKACILVLGMHRSGTSALTRVLNLLGCALPSDLLGSNHSNPEGHWESVRAIEINDSLLLALGRRWDDVRELPRDWLSRPETDIARQQIRAFVDREFSAKKLSLLKEPRLCHLAPLWIEVLEEARIEAHIVIPVRHPAEVAYSLARRDGIAVGRSHLLWMQHLISAELASRKHRRVITHFHELLHDWRTQVEHIRSALDVSWPGDFADAAALIDDFLRPSLPHADARSSDDIGSKMQLPEPVSGLYEQLTSRDSDEEACSAIADAARALEAAVSLFSPGIAELAHRLERAEREALAANKLLTSSIADRERRHKTADRIADTIDQTNAALKELTSEVQQQRLEPLIQDLTREILSQREEVIPALDSHGKALIGLLERIPVEANGRGVSLESERIEGMIEGIGREIIRQRAELIPALDSQGKSLEAMLGKIHAEDRAHASAAQIKNVGDALEGLSQEILRQRTEVIPALDSQGHAILQLAGRIESDIAQNSQQNVELLKLHLESQALLERTEPLVSMLKAVSDEVVNLRTKVTPTLDLHGRSLGKLVEHVGSQGDVVLPLLQRQETKLASLAESIQSQLVHRDQHIGELEKTISGLRQSLAELDGKLTRSRSDLLALEAENSSQAGRNDELEQEVDRQETLVSELTETIVLHDKLVVELRQGNADLVSQLEELGHQAYQRDRALAAKESQITGLSSELFEKESVINGLLASHSWRITKPLRLISAAIRGTSHVEPVDGLRLAGFDASWYLSRYPDIAASGLDPYEHFITAGRAEGRQPLPPLKRGGASSWVLRLRGMPWLGRGQGDSKAPNGMTDCAESAMSVADGEFDRDFYLLQYPDIASAGVDPYEHYVNHGKAEGREAAKPKLVTMAGGVDFDPSRETVLVVSHEASRTGAPVLSLNIARFLQRKYNVISFPLGGGPLVGAFRDESALLAGPMDLRGSPLRATLVIEQLLALHDVKFAIVNSIESRVMLEPLARNGVPAVSLIHEFAAYTRPKHAFRDAVFWAGETIFSTSITHDNAIAEFPELANRTPNIIPQGRCTLLSEAIDDSVRIREEARVLNALRPSGRRDDKIVVLGAGFVQQRKGVDLFLKCASRVLQTEIGKRCRFVWIGKGYDPENDMGYSVYLADQLRRAGLERQVLIMEETSSIETAYSAADILLVSSRLDPLPNVAIDAMAHGLPVICFDKTTGIADVLADAGLAQHLVAPYLDTADMADKVIALAGSGVLRKDLGEKVRQLVAERFDMARYIGQVERVAQLAGDRRTSCPAFVDEIVESGLVRPDFYLQRHQLQTPIEEVIEFDYLRSWVTGIGRRKLFPGFHPGVYGQAQPTSETPSDPLVEYLRAGQPDGPWKYQLFSSTQAPRSLPDGLRVALHLHVYYADMVFDILKRLRLNTLRPDLFISVPNADVADQVSELLGSYEGVVVDVLVVPNRGRDLGPLLTGFGPALLDNYDLVGHLHTKKSLDLKDELFAATWSNFLLENLLGGNAKMADMIVGEMAHDPGIGLVFPDDPYVVGWADNLKFAEEMAARIGISKLPRDFSFPIGTMFWARVEALRPMLGLGLEWDDYPHEPLPYDGTMLHALERIVPLAVEAKGYRVALTNVVGVSR